MADKNKGDGKFNQWLIIAIFIAVAFIVLVLWLNWYVLHNLIAHDSLNDRGTFGDMFGVSAALFSGLAFAGIIATIWMQREELSLQRQELKDTRKVLADQARQLESQSKTLIAQKDENTFFQMLKLHNDIVEKIQYERNNGRLIFIIMSKELKGYIFSISHEKQLNIKELNTFNILYKEFYINKRNYLGNYYRLLYHIIKFVSNSQLENKKRYTNIVRAQLSQPEMVLLYFNCLSDLGRKKFKPLVEKYALLKAMNFDGLKDFGDEALLKSHYKKGAFA